MTRTKLLFLLCFGLFFHKAQSQMSAPSIITEDCNGLTHDLYDKLNSGKIIVIGWTMPCTTCASPLLSVHNAVLNFAISHPNQVEYWVADDFGTTPCATIVSWCQNNGITNATYFSSKDIKMMDFGSDGMPKVVVVGCSNGTVYYNVDDTPNGSGVTAAINNALADIDNGCLAPVGVHQLGEEKMKMRLFPNPANGRISLIIPDGEYTNPLMITVTNSVGQIVIQKFFTDSFLYSTSIDIDINKLPTGIYYLRAEYKHNIFIEPFIKNDTE